MVDPAKPGGLEYPQGIPIQAEMYPVNAQTNPGTGPGPQNYHNQANPNHMPMGASNNTNTMMGNPGYNPQYQQPMMGQPGGIPYNQANMMNPGMGPGMGGGMPPGMGGGMPIGMGGGMPPGMGGGMPPGMGGGMYPPNMGMQTNPYANPNAIMFVPGTNNPQGYPHKAKSRRSQMVFCGKCQKVVTTLVTYEVGPGAWTLGGILCCFGLAPCSCIPCCVEDCQDAIHRCPSCSTFLGKRGFMFE